MGSLTVISHTEHYRKPDGSIVGLNSTVTEINHLAHIFDSVIHVAMLHNEIPPPNALPYLSKNITFIPLPPVGGPKLSDKLSIVFKAPRIINSIRKAILITDYFQFRAPTAIGVYVIPYLIYFSNKKGWFKYAGNWKQQHAPLAYRFQRWLLMKQNRKVTINGFWPDQPEHCLTFENPCLTQKEIEKGRDTVINKTFGEPIQLCFVGRLEEAKGLDLIIDALSDLNDKDLSKIGLIHIVGDGSRIEYYKKRAKDLNLPMTFHGYLSRTDVHDVYKKSHGILLPSASEGFPKVIAEAMNYGCVPIVSDVSSIGHYVKEGNNGFLIKTLNKDCVREVLTRFIDLSESSFFNLVGSHPENNSRFSYRHYNQRIKTEILEPTV